MYIMNLSQFANKKNISLLWEVLLDELRININDKLLINNIRTVFENNIKSFTSRSNSKTPIMELNKQFLTLAVSAVNHMFPNINETTHNNEHHIKRITITNEESGEPYKIEDIQALRQTEFEKETERKRMELEKYMTPKKPTEVDFSYENLDGKITSMDSLIANKMAQRNLDIEQLHNRTYNQSCDSEQWLTAKETSVKNEKNIPLSTQHINDRLKHINAEGNNNAKKTVTFSEPDRNQTSSVTIFEKLKTQQPSVEDVVKYVEQKSQSLPDVKQEQINRGVIVQSSFASHNIPTNELVKQLNDMNAKIDKLYNMVVNLTNSSLHP